MHPDSEARFPRGDKTCPTAYRTLLLRNLSDVLGENEPARRRPQ
jgi:hypothetical protein